MLSSSTTMESRKRPAAPHPHDNARGGKAAKTERRISIDALASIVLAVVSDISCANGPLTAAISGAQGASGAGQPEAAVRQQIIEKLNKAPPVGALSGEPSGSREDAIIVDDGEDDELEQAKALSLVPIRKEEAKTETSPSPPASNNLPTSGDESKSVAGAADAVNGQSRKNVVLRDFLTAVAEAPALFLATLQAAERWRDGAPLPLGIKRKHLINYKVVFPPNSLNFDQDFPLEPSSDASKGKIKQAFFTFVDRTDVIRALLADVLSFDADSAGPRPLGMNASTIRNVQRNLGDRFIRLFGK